MSYNQEIASINSVDVEEYLELDLRKELFKYIYDNGLMNKIVDLAADELSEWFYGCNEVITRKIEDVTRYLVGDEFDELFKADGVACVMPGQIDFDGNEVGR